MSRFIRIPGHRLESLSYLAAGPWVWTCQCRTVGTAETKADGRQAHAEHKHWVRWAHTAPSGAG
jgi:hypothetical protein